MLQLYSVAGLGRSAGHYHLCAIGLLRLHTGELDIRRRLVSHQRVLQRYFHWRFGIYTDRPVWRTLFCHCESVAQIAGECHCALLATAAYEYNSSGWVSHSYFTFIWHYIHSYLHLHTFCLQTKPLTVFTASMIWIVAILLAAPSFIVSDIQEIHIPPSKNSENLTILVCSPFGRNRTNYDSYSKWV